MYQKKKKKEQYNYLEIYPNEVEINYFVTNE